jgi:hypothetical protein
LYRQAPNFISCTAIQIALRTPEIVWLTPPYLVSYCWLYFHTVLNSYPKVTSRLFEGYKFFLFNYMIFACFVTIVLPRTRTLQ